MILEIIHYPDPRLKETCLPVDEITPEIRELAENMLQTMYSAHGVGLAAPQIGKKIRMIVMDPVAEENEKKPRILINPEVELIGDEVVSENEGCLSVPLNYRANVLRNTRIHLLAQDIDGNRIDEIVEDFPAIIIQHETDHLDGKLFIDKLSHLKRSLYDSKVKKWLKSKKDE